MDEGEQLPQPGNPGSGLLWEGQPWKMGHSFPVLAAVGEEVKLLPSRLPKALLALGRLWKSRCIFPSLAPHSLVKE